MTGEWFDWRARSMAALSRMAGDERLPEEVRKEMLDAVFKLWKMSSKHAVPRSKMLSFTAAVAALAARAALYGCEADAAAAIPQPSEIEDLAAGGENDPRISFQAWKARVVSALARASVAAADGDLKRALADAAELVAALPKPKRCSSPKARGVRTLIEAIDLVKAAAEECGSEELKRLIPSIATVESWVGCSLPPAALSRAPGSEKRPFSEEELEKWLAERLSAERGRVVTIALSDLLSVFKIPPGRIERVERYFERARRFGEWEYKGAVYVPYGSVRRRVAYVFQKTG